MAHRVVISLIGILCLACLGCAAPVEGLYPPPKGASTKLVYLVSHSWHAGIVVRRTDIPEGAWPEQGDFPDSQYLEVGWGDRRYYQTPDPDWGTALSAAFWPSSSVLHIVGFGTGVRDYFPNSEIIEIELSDQGFDRLIRYIAQSHIRETGIKAPSLGPGLYGNSRFYASRDTYHLFNTCNVWTARALRQAGLPIMPASAISVDDLMSQARAFDVLARPSPVAP